MGRETPAKRRVVKEPPLKERAVMKVAVKNNVVVATAATGDSIKVCDKTGPIQSDPTSPEKDRRVDRANKYAAASTRVGPENAP